MSTTGALLTALLLLAGNAFFVGAEFAMLTARRDRMETLAAEGVARARVVLRASRELPLLIAGAQLGITVCSLGLGALGEPAVAHLVEGPLEPLHLPDTLLHAIAFTVALAIVVTLHTVLGEMVPKNLAIAGPEKSALWLVPPHYAFCRFQRPVLDGFTWVAHRMLRWRHVEPKDELASAYTSEELSDLIGESRREGLLDEPEHRRLAQTLSSAERTVADVLVPLDRLTTVPANPTVGDVREAVTRTGFSRFPLLAADGRLVGYLHVKDVLDLADADAATPVPGSRVRGLPELPSDARLDDAVAALRRAHSHVARAVGPDGATRGVVALEDLVEEYVGTVRDSTHVRQVAQAQAQHHGHARDGATTTGAPAAAPSGASGTPASRVPAAPMEPAEPAPSAAQVAQGQAQAAQAAQGPASADDAAARAAREAALDRAARAARR